MPKALFHRRKSAGKSANSSSATRHEIAYHAAKLFIHGNAADYDTAKRKAVKQLGLKLDTPLPSDMEVEESVLSYQRLFHKKAIDARLKSLRKLALKAMTLLAAFSPRLVGSVLSGAITEHSVVNLLLFADPLEDVDIFLLNEHIPFDQTLETVSFPDGSVQQVGSYRITDKGESVEIMVLEAGMRKKLPAHAKGHPLLYRGVTMEELVVLIGEL